MPTDNGQGPENGKETEEEDLMDQVSHKAQEVASDVMHSKPVRIAKALSWVAGITPAFKLAAWGLKGQSTARKVMAPLFAAAALGTYLGAAAYGGLYAYVAAHDINLPIINGPATEGQWKGQIIRLSHKGTFPCDSYEGIIQTSASSRPDSATSDAYKFSVRKFQKGVLTELQTAIDKNQLVVMTYRDSPLDFTENSCIQHTDHTPHELRPVLGN